MTTTTTTAKINAAQIKTLNNLHANGIMLMGNGRPGCNSKSCKALVRKGLVIIGTEEDGFRYFEINDAGRSCITK
jgi:predicted transcriptional regulator with HTH domain